MPESGASPHRPAGPLPRTRCRAIPPLGLAVILAAALLGGPMAALAAHLPALRHLAPSPFRLGTTALLGGLLAAGINNLPAAAFGATWLRGAPPPFVVAYLVGTNVLALATLHGRLATLLCRSVARRAGRGVQHGPYLRAAWRFALVGTVAALAALVLLG